MTAKKPYVPSKEAQKKTYPISGLSYKKPDNSRLALPPGWRQSKATGNWYFENRKNRSDSPEDRQTFIENMTGYVKRGNNISICKSPLPNRSGYIIVQSTIAGRPLFYLSGKGQFTDELEKALSHSSYALAKKELDKAARKFNWTATRRKIKVKFGEYDNSDEKILSTLNKIKTDLLKSGTIVTDKQSGAGLTRLLDKHQYLYIVHFENIKSKDRLNSTQTYVIFGERYKADARKGYVYRGNFDWNWSKKHEKISKTKYPHSEKEIKAIESIESINNAIEASVKQNNVRINTTNTVVFVTNTPRRR